MNEGEAEQFAISPDDRHQSVRLDSAKVNVVPHAGRAAWFRLVSVPIGNGDNTYPTGDTAWTDITVDTWRWWARQQFERTTGRLSAEFGGSKGKDRSGRQGGHHRHHAAAGLLYALPPSAYPRRFLIVIAGSSGNVSG